MEGCPEIEPIMTELKDKLGLEGARYNRVYEAVWRAFEKGREKEREARRRIDGQAAR